MGRVLEFSRLATANVRALQVVIVEDVSLFCCLLFLQDKWESVNGAVHVNILSPNDLAHPLLDDFESRFLGRDEREMIACDLKLRNTCLVKKAKVLVAEGKGSVAAAWGALWNIEVCAGPEVVLHGDDRALGLVAPIELHGRSALWAALHADCWAA